MRKLKFSVILGLVALYCVVAVTCFMLHYGPTAGSEQLPATLVYCGFVVIPYALLGLAVYFAADRTANLWIGRTSIPVILLSLLVYSQSFSYNDGEYTAVYVYIPGLQSFFALIALGVSLWKRRRSIQDDPRIKRLLKRYRKGDKFVDAEIDVSHIKLGELLTACSCNSDKDLVRPKELDKKALSFFSNTLADAFDHEQYDFFLHSYVRTEFIASYYKDPTITSKPAPEGGPPAKISLPEGTQWVPVRPQEGREHYEAYDIPESNGVKQTPTIH